MVYQKNRQMRRNKGMLSFILTAPVSKKEDWMILKTIQRLVLVPKGNGTANEGKCSSDSNTFNRLGFYSEAFFYLIH